ncbi:hypothetical protein V8F06_013382 [Rhypophila decipiens]
MVRAVGPDTCGTGTSLTFTRRQHRSRHGDHRRRLESHAGLAGGIHSNRPWGPRFFVFSPQGGGSKGWVLVPDLGNRGSLITCPLPSDPARATVSPARTTVSNRFGSGLGGPSPPKICRRFPVQPYNQTTSQAQLSCMSEFVNAVVASQAPPARNRLRIFWWCGLHGPHPKTVRHSSPSGGHSSSSWVATVWGNLELLCPETFGNNPSHSCVFLITSGNEQQTF